MSMNMRNLNMVACVNVIATHFLETSIWTAKRVTKIKATQLIGWCKPFTSERRNWNTNTLILDKCTQAHIMLVSALSCILHVLASPKLDQRI